MLLASAQSSWVKKNRSSSDSAKLLAPPCCVALVPRKFMGMAVVLYIVYRSLQVVLVLVLVVLDNLKNKCENSTCDNVEMSDFEQVVFDIFSLKLFKFEKSQRKYVENNNLFKTRHWLSRSAHCLMREFLYSILLRTYTFL